MEIGVFVLLCWKMLAFVLVLLFQGPCLSHHPSCQEVQVGPMSSPGRCHVLDVRLMLSSSQPDLHRAAMCWDTYIPETTRGRLSTYAGQLGLAGSLEGGDDTVLVVVVVIYSPLATSPHSPNPLLSCYTTKHIADPWQGAAYALPNNSSSPPTHAGSPVCLSCVWLSAPSHATATPAGRQLVAGREKQLWRC